jgi:uncharacterized protein (DUF305 family)
MACAGVAAVLLVAGCGSQDEPESASGGDDKPAATEEHNAADVVFAQGMIPHHEQAVEMAKMARTSAESAEVKQLATAIAGAQTPEIETMSGWLGDWGEEVPSLADMTEHAGHAGMMSAEDMTALQGAKGAAFDRMFLEMMIQHHEGAVEMARTEQDKGRFTAAKELAADIEKSQTAEIATMKGALGQQ